MKKQFVLMVIAALFSITTVVAQDGGQRLTPEEQTKATIEKMAPLKLDAEIKAKAEVILSEFYTTSRKDMAQLREIGADRETMMAKRKELVDARDGKLKLIFTEAQLKEWIEVIEPSTRPQRQRGGGGGK